MIEPVCTPDGHLFAEGEAEGAAARKLAAAALGGPGLLLACLGTELLSADLPPAWGWLRSWSRRFLSRLCQTRDPGTATCPAEAECAAFAAAAPIFPGAEYAGAAVLAAWWEALSVHIAGTVSARTDGLEGWLREANPLWHLVGRVTFHLAENKTDSQRPFAFLATYTDTMSDGGRLQHLPLARALQQQASRKDQQALDQLLLPVRTAAERSRLLRDWLASRRLFQPMALTPPEAYAFLRESPLFQESGIVVKMPDWWKGGRPPRPVVRVSIDAPKAVSLDASSLLRFDLAATLGGEKLTDQEWAKLVAAESGLVSLRGQWIEVDSDQLQQVLAHWRRVERAHAGGGVDFHSAMRMLAGFRESLPAAGGGSATEGGLSWAEVVAGKNLAALLDRLRDPAALRPPASLAATLRPYQERGLAWLDLLAQLGFGGCLADDMGLGKTVQIIGLLALRRERGDRGAALLVVPASLVGNWKAEFARFAPALRVFYAHPSVTARDDLAACAADPAGFLAGYDALLTTYQFLQRTPAWQGHRWAMAVLDEAQAIKNPGTGATKAVKQVNAPVRFALTGTPVENRPGDLWSLFDFLNPGLLGGATAFAAAVKQCAGSAAGFAPLRRLVQPYILRRLKTDRRIISDLPDKTEVKAWCGLTKRQAKLYARLVEDLARLLDDPDLEGIKRRGLVLGFLMKFKQVCNHPSHWNADGVWAPDDSGKFLRLAEICGELAERREKALVFTQFQETCDPLARFLAGVFGRDGLVLHGGTPVAKRAGLVAAFQQPGGPPFFVISVKAGGTGLNLTAASHVIHFDRWWNPAVENQATDRAFRIGQRLNVMVHKFICQGTVEERIDALIEEKKALAAELLGGGSGAEGMLTEMGRDELLRFVSLDLASAVL